MPQNKESLNTKVKDSDLVDLKRKKIIKASLKLFSKKGFHKTSTREITTAAGISTGSLYSYIRSKEGILFLVCESIYAEIELNLRRAIHKNTLGIEELIELIREFFLICHRYSDHILIIYQEIKSLSPLLAKQVFDNEIRIANLFTNVIENIVKTENINIDEPSIELTSHNIIVLGHMWAFRKWFLALHYNIEEYLDIQTAFIMRPFKK